MVVPSGQGKRDEGVIVQQEQSSVFFLKILFFFFLNFIYFWLHFGSLLLHVGFLQLWGAGATLPFGAQASHWGGFSWCRVGLQACMLQQLWLMGSRVQAQQLWHTGLLAPWHVGSSRTRDRTHAPCIGRWILNHCTTRKVPELQFYEKSYGDVMVIQYYECIYTTELCS